MARARWDTSSYWSLILFPIIVQIIDYVHPKSVAETARIDCRCVTLIGYGTSVFVRTSCGGTLTFLPSVKVRDRDSTSSRSSC